jgi:hypothetical protein
MRTFGIYGYECTNEIKAVSCKIMPFSKDIKLTREKSRKENVYELTAFVEVDDCSVGDLDQFLFDLEAILTFVEHRSVIINNELFVHESMNDLPEDFPTKIFGNIRVSSGGHVIHSDYIKSNSRGDFIELALSSLENNVTRASFFRVVESIKGSSNFIDVQYYLQFSALESLCRHEVNMKSGSVITAISKHLNSHGFDVYEHMDKSNLYKSIGSYSALRNALFHNASLSAEVNIDNEVFTLELTDFSYSFGTLVSLVLIKHIGFDDGCINWNAWLDRMMFK